MSTNAHRFGQIVLARRLALDLNQLDVSAAGGPSNSTMTNIENGRLEELTRATAKKLDKGLRWESGSARTAWQGGDPTPLLTAPQPVAHDDMDALRRYIGEAVIDEPLRRRLLAVLDDSRERGATG